MIGRQIDQGGDDGETAIPCRHRLELQTLVMGGKTSDQLRTAVQAQDPPTPIDHGEPGAQLPGLQSVTTDKEPRLPLSNAIVKEIHHVKTVQQATEAPLGPK